MSHVQGGVMSPGGQTTATAYTIPFGSSVQVGVPMSAVSPLSMESRRGLQLGGSSVIAGNTFYAAPASPVYQTYQTAPSSDAFLNDMQTKYGAYAPAADRSVIPVQTMSNTSSALSQQRSAPVGSGIVVGSIVREELGHQENIMDIDLDLHREMARQETIDFNMKHNIGAVKGATTVSRTDGSRGVVFDLDGSIANGTSMDHVQRRRLLNAVSSVPEKPKYRAHHAPTNVNNVVRNLALSDKAATRGTKLGTGIQPESATASNTTIQYQLSVVKPKATPNGPAAASTYGGSGINAAVRNKAVSGAGNLAFGDHNIIRDELKKEDDVLHPYRTLDDHRGFTRAQTEEFAGRGWSPLR